MTANGEAAKRRAARSNSARIVFALDLDTLGRVELQATLAADRIRVTLSSDLADATEQLAAHAGVLRQALGAAGFVADELRYETRTGTAGNAVTHSVAEHIVRRDSVSRLV